MWENGVTNTTLCLVLRHRCLAFVPSRAVSVFVCRRGVFWLGSFSRVFAGRDDRRGGCVGGSVGLSAR